MHGPTALAVTGGSGALGVHVLRHLLQHSALPIRALVHRTELADEFVHPRVVQVRGDLLDRDALRDWLGEGAAAIHLAFSPAQSRADHLRSVAGLADAAAQARITRFVHCSTAVVVGRTRARVITEDTVCEPATEYERDKHAIELAFEAAATGRFPLTIIRPTAVFGPGLRNLVNLIESLRQGRPITNYARASLFGRRHLHLVPVETVAAALLYVALDRDRLAGAREPVRYIVSADHEPGGDFCSVESRIRVGLGLPRSVPAPSVPAWVLRLALQITGRSDTDPYRCYDASRLQTSGFRPPVRLQDALDHYVAWYRAQSHAHGAE